ncbi:MAG: pilus assembly protein CpaF, partial [Actinomycetota bacterium]|nr:pilus assembly protein CpaF [Actinomycetota bacterium]
MSTTEAVALKRAVHTRLLREPGASSTANRTTLRERLTELLRDEAPLVPHADAQRILDELIVEVDGLGPLEALLSDPDVTEIMLNGPGRAYVERSGRLFPVALDLDGPAIVRLAERIIAPLGLRLDRSAPMADARLPDGSRLHAVLPPLAPDGPCVTIRRFVTRSMSLHDFGIDPAAASFLEACVRGGWNVLVAGATSTGKTTLLNVMSSAIDGDERVVTIEETAELRLRQPHVVRLEARPANGEGVGAVGVRELVRAALRMRPDRVVVGEVRGAEALDMLQALNTGHDGSMCTLHANSALDALSRLETLVLFADVGLPPVAVRAHITAAIDAVVFVARGADGGRRVEHVVEVEAGPTRRLAVRRLFEREDDALVRVEAPRRPARRAGHDLLR